MLDRRIQGLDKNCSATGFGAWGIGGATPGGTSYGDIDEDTAQATISAAFSAGMRFFDTAPVYGYGQSETRLGKALAAHRKQIILATKGGLYDYDKGADFSVASLDEGLDASLKRLATPHVDLYQLHNPTADVFSRETCLADFLDQIKADGRASLIGVSVKSPSDAFALLKAYPFETIQLNFNMLDLRALTSGLLDHCAEKGIAVLARTPLCFGFLSLKVDENTTFAKADHRAHWPREQLALWASGAQQAQNIAARHDPITASPAARALRFCLLHKAVKSVLTGPMTPAEALENAAACAMPPLETTCLKEISQLNASRSFLSKR